MTKLEELHSGTISLFGLSQTDPSAQSELRVYQDNPLSLTMERSKRLQRILEIANLYGQKVKVAKIAKEYGCTTSTVLRIARAFNLNKRERGDAYLKKCCIKAYKRNVPISTIAQQCGRSPAWVSKTAGQAGILRRTFKPRAA